MFRNSVINGGFNVNQRVASSNMTAMSTTAITSSAPSAFFVADRWIAYRTGLVANGQMALMTLSNSDLPFTAAGLTNFARIGRASGDTFLSNVNLVTNLETINSIPMAAKTVTLSFYCRAGANYSGSNSGASSLAMGVLTDQNYVANSLGAGASTLNNSFTATTSWQRISYSYSVPATATQVAPLIGYTPSGTAGAADYLDVTGVQLEIASSPTGFELRPYAVELGLCQRYHWQAKAIGSTNLVCLGYTFANGTGNARAVLNLPVPMRLLSPNIATANGGMTSFPTGNLQPGTISNDVILFNVTSGGWVYPQNWFGLDTPTCVNFPLNFADNRSPFIVGNVYEMFANNGTMNSMGISAEL